MKEIKVFEEGDNAKIKKGGTHWLISGEKVKIEKMNDVWYDVVVEATGVKHKVNADDLEFYSKFKVGDKVVAKKNAPYSISTDGWTGVVTKVYNDGTMLVNGEGFIGNLGACVEERYFDLYQPICCNEIKEIKKEFRKLIKKLKKLCKNY